MYLKSMEIRGFKSFADKTELIFRDGITAVVGPNGSGKSNISDAVRWVLGEQSVKQLRGGKMEDVIFAGTQFRKALGQASVSLTMDNSDGTLNVPYNEVTVTRRLYRSGESEYLLNNNNVRLRDIHELFMDTGVGREGYSMIGQGKIDAILSGKPEERRGLVEEAAGIVKYKSRKEEGEKKLKNAEENLTRVEDIISTYEERIEPLRNDKEKAEKFIVLNDEMKSLMTSILISDLEELSEKNSTIIEKKKELDETFSETSKNREEAEEKNRSLDDSLSKLSDLRISKREEYYENKSRLDNLNSEIKIRNNSKESERVNLVKAEETIKILIDNVELLKTEKEALIKNIEDSKNESLEVKDTLESLRSSALNYDSSIENTQTEIENTKSKQDEVRAQMRLLEHNIADEVRKKNFLEGRKESISSNKDSYKTSLQLNESSRDKIQKELDELILKMDALKKQLKEETDKLKSDREILDNKFNQSEKIRREIRDAENRISILKNLEDNHEGYNKAVKDLMNYLKKTNSPYLNSAHIVGEVISSDKKYALAIEAALGGYIQNIITDTDDEAKKLIAELKRNNLGRCTFLPLNIIRPSKIAMPRLVNSKVLGFASDLVTFDEKFRPIVENILARTLVAKDMDEAVKVARETSYRIKIVTLEGDIISSGGAMTGGSQKVNKSGILSRKNDLEKLSQMVKKNKEDLVAFEEEYKITKSKLDKEASSIYEKNDRLRAYELEKIKLEERVFGFKKEVDKLFEVLSKEDDDILKMDQQLKEATEKVDEFNRKIEENKKEVANLDEALITLRDKRQEYFRLSDEIKEKITEVRLKEREKESSLNHLEENLNRVNEAMNEEDRKYSRLKMELDAFKKSIEEADAFIESSEKETEKLDEILKALEKEIEEIEVNEVKFKSDLKSVSGRLDSIREEYYLQEKEMLKVSMALEKYESDREDIINKINEDLGLTLAEAKDKVIPLESKIKSRKRVNELKSSITALGNVNLASIEEYQKVSEHYNFLTKQRDDLLKAKDELLDLINEITSKMRSLFRENFETLKKNFSETFRQLFNGGTGELSLSGEDMLSSNIEINVQPPGKKLQNINLMSGGEKVLSAIALTFAILRMKPSPFCILDEIEAALDDANVYRYASFLEEFAKETQFILITHRKGTMEAANVLYGVTMEEKGISKIVTVDLEKATEVQ